MSNIIKELGSAFIRERFGGCMFFDEEKNIHYIDENNNWPKERVGTIKVAGPPTKPTTERSSIPNGFFTSLAVFGVPPLGWRQAAQGRYLTYFTRNNRSYHRAVAHNNLQRTNSPATQYLMDSDNLSGSHYYEPHVTALLVMAPEYTKFREGLAAMREGEIFSFAISPTLAVIPDVDEQQSLLFNMAKIATITSDGELQFTNQNVRDLTEGQL